MTTAIFLRSTTILLLLRTQLRRTGTSRRQPDGKPEPWTLSLDRTEWLFGDCVFILMLGVVYKVGAFLVIYCLLDKRGSSNWDEHITLFNPLLGEFRQRTLG